MGVLKQAYEDAIASPPVADWSDARRRPAAMRVGCEFCRRPFQRSAFTPSGRAAPVVAVTYRYTPFRIHDEVRLYHPGCYQQMRELGIHTLKRRRRSGPFTGRLRKVIKEHGRK